MIINDKEYGVYYDNLCMIQICEELGYEYTNDLQEAYQKAFKALSEGLISVAYLKIQIALIHACVNRWCEREKKDYGLTKDEIVDLDQETAAKLVKEVFEFIGKNSPKGEEKEEGSKKK